MCSDPLPRTLLPLSHLCPSSEGGGGVSTTRRPCAEISTSVRGTEPSPPQTEATAQHLLSVSLGLNEPQTQKDVCEGYRESLFAIVQAGKKSAQLR